MALRGNETAVLSLHGRRAELTYEYMNNRYSPACRGATTPRNEPRRPQLFPVMETSGSVGILTDHLWTSAADRTEWAAMYDPQSSERIDADDDYDDDDDEANRSCRHVRS